MIVKPKYKRCPMCKERKDPIAFYWYPDSGFSSYCKRCMRKYSNYSVKEQTRWTGEPKCRYSQMSRPMEKIQWLIDHPNVLNRDLYTIAEIMRNNKLYSRNYRINQIVNRLPVYVTKAINYLEKQRKDKIRDAKWNL